MSHTPGPWKIKREYGLRQRIQQANDGGTIAYMTSRPFAHCGNFSHGQITANARLIAAAPDLLHAVYVAHGTFKRQLDADGMGPDSWGDDEHQAFSALSAAIAKAEGPL